MCKGLNTQLSKCVNYDGFTATVVQDGLLSWYINIFPPLLLSSLMLTRYLMPDLHAQADSFSGHGSRSAQSTNFYPDFFYEGVRAHVLGIIGSNIPSEIQSPGGVRRLSRPSTNQKVDGSMSGCSSVHSKASLGKTVTPKLLIRVWMWVNEACSRKHYIRTSPFIWFLSLTTSVKHQVDTLLPSIGGNGNILI